jgi:hypothetical protein
MRFFPTFFHCVILTRKNNKNRQIAVKTDVRHVFKLKFTQLFAYLLTVIMAHGGEKWNIESEILVKSGIIR